MPSALVLKSKATEVAMILRSPIFLLTHLVFILTILMGGRLLASAHAMDIYAHAYNRVPDEFDAMSDLELFAWGSGGSLIGAYIGIVQAILSAGKSDRTIPMPEATDTWQRPKIVLAFSVSLLTGILATPAIAYSGYIGHKWPFVFLVGGLVAWSAWMVWYIINKILGHFMKRAEKEGISGVIDEAKRTGT